MSFRNLRLALLFSVAASLLPAVDASAACAAAPPRVYLTGFALNEGYRPFYLGPEPDAGQNPATFTVRLTGGCDVFMGAGYDQSEGTAVEPEDYQRSQGSVGVQVPAEDTRDLPAQVPVNADADTESIVEAAQIVLHSAVNAQLSPPSTAPLFILDADGATRVGFDPDPYSQSETFAPVRIPVFLAGPATGGTVSYSIEPSGASPATHGADFTGPTSGTLTYAPNDRMKTIDFSLVNDDQGEGPEEVTLTVSGLGPASSTTFTIVDNEESEPPTSRIHHPRHKWKYKKSDFRIREVHVFATDAGGAGVTGAQFGLRRNMKNGDCLWLTKQGWQKKECSNRQWLETRYDDVGQLWFYRPKQLKSSVGTKIKDYTAFSRAIDGAGNVEKDFNEKRNANTFEVKRSKKR
jgi:Calx-beta domain